MLWVDLLPTSPAIHCHPPYNGGIDTVTDFAPARPETKPTGCHPSNALSAAFLRSAPPGRHSDGNGLYLFVQPSGTRSWIQRLVVRGRRRELGLGSVSLVPLAEAREKALSNRKLARQGGDPLAEKLRAEGIPTFAEAASRVLEQKRDGWRGKIGIPLLFSEHEATVIAEALEALGITDRDGMRVYPKRFFPRYGAKGTPPTAATPRRRPESGQEIV